MNRIKTFALATTVIVLILGGALALTFAQDTPPLSGITIEDEHPNGCIDCHRDAGEGNDYRLNVSLDEAGHPNVSAMIKKVPGDCGICHKAGTPLGGMSELSHKAHFEEPSENHFVTAYNGECLACHSLNSATGEVTMKSGPKNW